MKKYVSKIKRMYQSLKTYEHFAGKDEVIRGAARVALRTPSDFIRGARWRLMGRLIPSERILLSLPKFDMLVDKNCDGIASELAIDGDHESFGTKILLSLLEDDMTVVEVGANLGYYVLSEAKHRKLKKIVAIEPNPDTFQTLSDNVKLNHCDEVELHNLGISDREATLPFYISKQSNISSITPKAQYERIIDVPVMRLDEFIKQEKVGKVDLIRMDLEGHEIQVLRGMQKTLKRNKLWLCLEYHSPMISVEEREEFIETLESLDYELKGFTFRWADYYIFGRHIVDYEKIWLQSSLREALEKSPSQTLLLFIGHKDMSMETPKF